MKLIVKVLYLPFGIAFGFLGKLAGRQLFGVLWSRVDREAPPAPRTAGASLGKVVLAAALQAGTYAATRAAADRAAARTFQHLIGAWPDQPPMDVED
jgi:hypothetical protein